MGSVEIIGSGQFPQWLIQTQKSLEWLDLRNCSIKGTLPAAWLGSLKNLTDLDLSNNFINGSIPESLMCQMKDLYRLDLSRNHLSGHLPDCHWGNLNDAILSYNQLSGPIPNPIGGGDYLQKLQLSNNSLTGPIPFILTKSNQLIVLDLGGDNKLSGNLPEWIGDKPGFLFFLRLRNNKFDGDIPSSYCQLSVLQLMDLSHNKLTGCIPRYFGNLSGMITEAGSFPGGIEYTSLNEVMKGELLEYTSWTSIYLVINLDLSSNHLFGIIPEELTNLTRLNGFNLSYNRLGGTIPQRIGRRYEITRVDLSSNNLYGQIPGNLSKLMSLSHLNLSNNDLSGPIPTGPQLQTLNDPSSYVGNPRLCGDPLPKK